MLKENRHKKIIELINQDGTVQTADLCKKFQTTRQTIHNDLETLSQNGKLKKVYGGAMRVSKSEEPAMKIRQVYNQQEKDIIGRVATTFINEKDTIFLDVSTTVNAMLPYIKEFNDLTIITNSIEAAYALSTQTLFEIIMIGGHVRSNDLACGGNMSIQALENIFVDKSFFGTGGVSMTAGLTDYHFTDSDVRKVMINHSIQSFVLFDTSKIETITISKFADFSDIDKLISYHVKNKDWLEFISNEETHFIDAKDYLATEETK